MVERNLAEVDVARSNRVARYILSKAKVTFFDNFKNSVVDLEKNKSNYLFKILSNKSKHRSLANSEPMNVN